MPDRSHIRLPVAVLGATGAVGQMLVERLVRHPWFELRGVAASERTVGQRYGQARRGRIGRIPDEVLDWPVQPCDPDALETALVFSALDADTARKIEPQFARAGVTVISNASAFRLETDVPLVIPEVNAHQLGAITAQRELRGWSGAIVTNPNCAATIAALALAPIHARFEIRRVIVTTLQAISGAGHPGIPAWDAIGNMIPHIQGEAEKIQAELPKLLGPRNGGLLESAPFPVSARATRVPVSNGHMACLTVECTHPPTPDEARACLQEWRGEVSHLNLPSAPDAPLLIVDECDGPQPRRDLDSSGMRVAVGQIRSDPVLDLSLVALGDNLVRGAAGAALLNAELWSCNGLEGSGERKNPSSEAHAAFISSP